MSNFKIKTKLILLFIIIKVLPLLLLSYIAIEGAKKLNNYFEKTTKDTFEKSKSIITTTATTAISDSINALDKKSQLTLERLSYETANNIASFLYERDKDLLFLSTLKLNDQILQDFQNIKTSPVAQHAQYTYDKVTSKWVLQNQEKEKKNNTSANLKDNEKEFHVNSTPNIQYKNMPLYKEIQFIDLDGNEIYKTSSIKDKKTNVQNITNTYCKAEDYFNDLKHLKKGEIYVSDVIGEYIGSKLIGTFTEEKASKMNIEFSPQDHAYAGKENPVGKRFEGIIRFATPMYQNNKKIGYLSFALDHRHIMEFTDSLDPSPQNNKQDISDASSGNYAFMWDYKGRNISHARDYFIMGYNKETGKQVPGWVSLDIADKFKKSKQTHLNHFLANYPTFEEQALTKKPNISQLKQQGEIGLDCRYLNFAPQCEGWMQLTQGGGYGSFVIFWSGVWKLTTAATIPYYTGRYANNKRGFGFVTIGANVDEFHLAANKTKDNVNKILDTQVANMKQELNENKFSITRYINNLTNELITVTLIMVLAVIAIAIWMSNLVTNKISNLLLGTQEYLKHNFNYKINITSKDEIGELEQSFNNMAEEIKELINVQKDTNTLLEIKAKEANTASKAKSDFLASMSHEIRTPLNAILGFISILKEQEKDKANLEYYDIIDNSSNNLIKIINDILDFSKIESNNIQIDTVEINLYTELEKITQLFTKNTNTKSLTFNVQISSDLSKEVRIDLIKITQVINNLLANAIKFSTEQGTVSIEMKYIKNNHLYVSIENDGIQIAKDKQKMIFDAFTQEDNTTTRKYGGTGLGLTISKKLIEIMGGELKLDSTKQNGARFYLEVPFSIMHDITLKEKSFINQDVTEVNEAINTNINILIVEDNLSNQLFMKIVMKKLSLKYEIANNGIEALELYKNKHFDLILMDENMPKMSGSEATIKIRILEKETKRHIPIIALTANTLEGDIEKFLQTGMDDYLPKPVKMNSIKTMIVKHT